MSGRKRWSDAVITKTLPTHLPTTQRKPTIMKTSINLNNKTILITGNPGFIGANLVLRLLATLSSGTIASLDNLSTCKTSEKDEKHEAFKEQNFSWAEKWV